MEHNRNAAVVDAIGQSLADGGLALRRDGAAQAIGGAIGIRSILHGEPNGALELFELAPGAATVQIRRIAIIAMFARFANAIAANDRLAGRVAIHRARRFALFTRRHVDTSVAACRCGANAATTKTAHTGAAIHGVCPGGAFLAGLTADHDRGARFGAIACIHVDAIGIGHAGKFAIGFAAGIGAIAAAEIAFFAHFQLAVATNRRRSLTSAVHAGIRSNACGIRADVRRRANEIRIACGRLTNRRGWTIDFRIDARTSAIGIAAVAIEQIAVVADFSRIEYGVTAYRRRANSRFADTSGRTRHAVAERRSARMRRIIAFRRHARIQIRAISGRIAGQTRKLTIVATVTRDDIAVFAFFGFTHEKIAALVWTANPGNANLHIRTSGSVRRSHSRTAGMIIQAFLFAITWIRIVAFRIARRRTRIVASKIAIRFATIPADHVRVVARFETLDDAIATHTVRPAGTGTSTLAAFTSNSSTTACRRRLDDNGVISPASCERSRRSKAHHSHNGCEPT